MRANLNYLFWSAFMTKTIDFFMHADQKSCVSNIHFLILLFEYNRRLCGHLILAIEGHLKPILAILRENMLYRTFQETGPHFHLF